MATKVKSGTKGKGKSATSTNVTGANVMGTNVMGTNVMGTNVMGTNVTGANANLKPNPIVSNPELPETDDMEIYKMIDIDTIDTFIEDIYKNYTYTTEDEINRKSKAEKRINELKAQFEARLNSLYIDYKDTGKDFIRERAEELIESYKLQMESVLKRDMFVYKTAQVPTPAEVTEARRQTALIPVQQVIKKQSSYGGKEKKLIDKIRRAENYTAEINELDKQIAALDESYKSKILEESEQINEWGDKKMADIVDRYKFKKEEEEKIQQSKEIHGEPTDKELQMQLLEDAEGRELNSIQLSSTMAIITLKHKYLKMAESGVKLEPPANIINAPEPEVIIQDTKLYVTSLLHHKIKVPFNKIGNNMDVYFKKYAEKELEGKCRKEGYIRPNSSTIVSYSTGLLKGDSVVYDVVYSVDACFPYENMELMCKIKNITKIGIRGVITDTYNPIVLFISREHNANKNFEDYEEGQTIKIRVIGHRFELNDEFISVIGEIL